MWELNHQEGWSPKNWCFWTVVLEKTFESPLDCKEIKPVTPKGNQPWIFLGRTDAETETPIFWPPDVKSQLIGKDPNAGNYWRQKKKGRGREWNGSIASLTRCTWIWTNSRRQWRTGKPGKLPAYGITKSQTWFSNWATTTNDRPRYMSKVQTGLHKALP